MRIKTTCLYRVNISLFFRWAALLWKEVFYHNTSLSFSRRRRFKIKNLRRKQNMSACIYSKIRVSIFGAITLSLLACGGQSQTESLANNSPLTSPPSVATVYNATVNLGGNAFITSSAANASEAISDAGLGNWTNATTVTSVYFRLAQAGQLKLGIVARLAGSSASTVKVTITGIPYNVNLSGATSKTYDVGTINIATAGYVKVDLQGISKNGGYFGDVSALKIAGSAATTGMQYANDPANYYWSRRGPSVNTMK
jgi:hypothetical protein